MHVSSMNVIFQEKRRSDRVSKLYLKLKIPWVI